MNRNFSLMEKNKKTKTEVNVKIDPIIAVRDVEASSKWYQQILGFRRAHGEKEKFAVLVSENDDVLLCLHKWGEHEHPTMTNPGVTPGNGLILYFRTENINDIYQNAEKLGHTIEEGIHVNPNSTKKEFSLRDPDGYFLTVTEFHKYEG
jgi:catechol 2,3-dioxygenase-like lactoylglutathione lyase family enzyme